MSNGEYHLYNCDKCGQYHDWRSDCKVSDVEEYLKKKESLSCKQAKDENIVAHEPDYYKINADWKMVQDIIEAKKMNYSQGNILKSAFCLTSGRHSGTDYKRELEKIIWFAQRELNSIKEKIVDNDTDL